MGKPDKVQVALEAIRRGNLAEVKKAMGKKVPVSVVNSSGQTPLHIACAEGHFLIVEWLTSDKKKANVDATDRDGWTPLHCACHGDHIEIVDLLIGKNADVCKETANGSSAMDYFVRMQSQSSRPALFERLFRTMIRKGVNINKQNQSGETPLHMAAFRGKDQSVSLLLWNQADPNIKNKYGETALHLATRAGYMSVVKKLVDGKADYTIEGSRGTPYQVAKNSHNEEMVQLYEKLLGPSLKTAEKVATPPVANSTPTTPVVAKQPEPTPAAYAQPKPVTPTGGFSYAQLQPPTTSSPYASWGTAPGSPAVAPNSPAAAPAYMTFTKFPAGQPINTTTPTHSIGSYTYAPTANTNPYGSIGVVPYAGGVNPNPNAGIPTNVAPTPVTTAPTPVVTNPTPVTPAPEPIVPVTLAPEPAVSPKLSPKVSPKSTRKKTGSRRGTSRNTKNSAELGKEKEKPKAAKQMPKNLEHYALGECIGSGAFGAVYNGFDTLTGAIVAIKQISLTGIPDDELANIMAELTLLQKLEYKYIVKYIGFIRNEEHLNIILEFIEGGSLQTILKKFGGKTQEPLCARYVAQTLLGLDYLHRRGVVHRDIKSGNILVTKDGVVKLADFGIASVSEAQAQTGDKMVTLRNVDQHKDEANNTDAVGSPYWMAPEVILMRGASSNSDIWSLGCTIIELLTGDPPYITLPPMSALFAMVQDEHPPLPENLSPELYDFLGLCFKKEPSDRPKARDLLTHKWILDKVGDLSHELSGKTGATLSKATSSTDNRAPIKKRADVPVYDPPKPIKQAEAEAAPEPERAPVPVNEPEPEPIAPGEPTSHDIEKAAAEEAEKQAAKQAQILEELNCNYGLGGAPVAGPGGFTMIPTLSGVMENLMGLQDAFKQAGVPISQPPQNQFAMNLPVVSETRILEQPKREEDSEEEEEDSEESENTLAEKAFNKDCTTIKEYMNWIQQSIKAERGSRACKIRKALRKTLPPMRVKYHDRQEARELCKDARNVIREVEEAFPDNLGYDTDDTDYDSEDSFFLASEGEEEDLYF